MDKNNFISKVRTKKFSVLLASLLLIIAIGVCGTVAYLIANSETVINTFIPGTIKPEIVEKIDGNIKESVKITNKGTTDAYIRAMVLVTWKDTSGKVYRELPVLDSDYSMNLPASTKWVPIESEEIPNYYYYYYNEKVSSGETTDSLLTEGIVLDTATIPSGYNLSIEIITQAIQAEPTDAIIEAWGTKAAKVVGVTTTTN